MLKTKHKIALASLVQNVVMGGRRVAGKGTTTQVERSGVRWELDLREGIDFSIWLLGSFEPETVSAYQSIVRQGDVVIDIGANIGAHTLLLAKAVGEAGRVIAIEPTDFAYAKLCRNRSLNPELAERIHPVQSMLVGDGSEDQITPELYSSWPLGKNEGVHELHQGRLMTTTGARARTLDSVVEELAPERVDCIKLDIDGFECEMFRGAARVLKQWHPTFIMELAPYALEEQGASLEQLISLLQAHDYDLFDLANRSRLPLDSTILEQRIPPGASMNVIARHGANGMRQ